MSRLESLPLELLFDIIRWVCWNEIDLGMSASSKSIRSAWLAHPLAQTLGALRMQKTKSEIHVVGISAGSRSEISPDIAATSLCPSALMTVEETVKRSWCRDDRLQRLQIAIVRTLVKVNWKPYLQRDRRLDRPRALEDILARMTLLCQQQMDHGEAQTYTLFDTLDQYSWTHLDICPQGGRVTIRDQLSNTYCHVHVSVAEIMRAARSTARAV